MHKPLTEQQKWNIKNRRFKANWSIKRIARDLGISDRRVSAFLNDFSKEAYLKAKQKESTKAPKLHILSPTEIALGNGIFRGILLDKITMKKIISLINRNNANGLKGKDAVLLIQLNNALQMLDSHLLQMIPTDDSKLA